MNLRSICILSLATATLIAPKLRASNNLEQVSAEDSVAQEVDDEQSEIRENPVIEITDDDSGIVVPKFVNSSRNFIQMNGADWSRVAKALSNARRNPFSIVHIGDSHLQADISSGTVREFMQYDFGNAGRGLVVPLKMTGTNQPSDYTITSTRSWVPAKLMRGPWPHTMGFTGTSIRPSSRSSEITIATREDLDYNPFSSITVFHNGRINVTGVKDATGKSISFKPNYSKDYTHLDLMKKTTSVTIKFETEGDLTFFGASLSGNRPGVFYHTIGNNGATFATYNNIGTVGQGINPLQPDLIIISLGTNESFGRFNAKAFMDGVDKLVNNIRTANPGIPLLIVTPMECQCQAYKTVNKKVRKKVKVPVRNQKGKRVRYKTQMKTVTEKRKVASGYAANPNVASIRESLITYGREHKIAVYDWYDVAGGTGASTKWIGEGLFGRDRVHHTSKGYRLQGYMLYKALMGALSK